MLRVALGLSILVMIWRGAAISLHLWDYNTGVFYLRPWFRFDAIAVGCWLALARLPRSPTWFFGFSAVGLTIWSIWGELVSRPLFITIQTIFAAALLSSVIEGGLFARRLLSPVWLRWFGGISYSLYLWQQILTVSRPKLGWICAFPVNIFVAIILAVLSREFIEKPFLVLGRRIVARTSRGKIAVTVVV